MQILPNHYYVKIMRHKEWEKLGRCMHLNVKELTPQEKERYKDLREEKDIPTHKVTFYDFEFYQALEGKIKENTPEKLILYMGEDKEYEFRPFKLALD